MKFTAYPPPQPKYIFGSAWTIAGEGEVDEYAPEALAELLAEKKIPGRSILALHSRGGDLFEGMKLGRVIRDAHLLTYVGRASPDSELCITHISAGECYSACCLAFLGGVYRFMPAGSVYGVHRFYSQRGAITSDDAQVHSAEIIQFLRDMEVDVGLFNEMSRVGGNEINILAEADLLRLGIINNGQQEARWTIESNEGVMYLKGDRETFRGINKFILFCSPTGKVLLHVIFDPEGRAEEVMEMPYAALLFDEKTILLDKENFPHPPFLTNGLINCFLSLSDDHIKKLSQAKTVGVGFMHGPDSPTFLGFQGIDFTEGSKKLPGFLAAFRRR